MNAAHQLPPKVLTVGELKRELFHYPNDWEVHVEVRGEESPTKGVDMVTAGASTWILIHDYPSENNAS